MGDCSFGSCHSSSCCRRIWDFPIGVISPLLTYVFHARCLCQKKLLAPPPTAEVTVVVIVIVMSCHVMFCHAIIIMQGDGRTRRVAALLPLWARGARIAEARAAPGRLRGRSRSCMLYRLEAAHERDARLEAVRVGSAAKGDVRLDRDDRTGELRIWPPSRRRSLPRRSASTRRFPTTVNSVDVRTSCALPLPKKAACAAANCRSYRRRHRHRHVMPWHTMPS